jgi:two-component system sensor histidine kinase VicK
LAVELPALEGFWDRDRLDQVLDNLLSNATKYSPAGGEIVLQIESSDGRAMVSVRDAGIGVAESELPRLFDDFYRAASATGDTPGLGLGLFIVKSLVEGHGGRVWAESTPGRGTTVRFTLPLPTA